MPAQTRAGKDIAKGSYERIYFCMRKINERRGETGLEIVCAWCGGVIRRSSARAGEGMCESCFARMIREYIRTYQSAVRQPGTSER